MLVGPTDEDCLYLNVWAPSAPRPTARPVLVWIHGGGLFGGSSSEPVYRGAKLAASADAVVVGVNYRLGVLGGFIRLSDVGDSRLADAQDLGLLDLILALDWIKHSVEAFGGNPECVTIFGQSAGAHCVGALLASPLARGLFQRAILQSPQRLYFHDEGQAAIVTQSFEDAFGGSLSLDLYGAEAERILAAQDVVLAKLLHTDIGVPFMASVHPQILPYQLMDLAAAGDLADVPLLVGTTVDETRVLFPSASTPAEERNQFDFSVKAMLPDASEAERRVLWECYAAPSLEPGAPKPPNPSAWFAADYMVRIPAERLLVAQSSHQASTYSYLFNVPSQIGLGSFHCLELPYIFGTIDEPEWREHVQVSLGLRLTAVMQQAWSSFAREGAPSADSLPEWIPFDDDQRSTMVLEEHPRVMANPWGARSSLWASLG
jgi:para-nitrobenzyl esterase